jgi:hypothetical protein
MIVLFFMSAPPSIKVLGSIDARPSKTLPGKEKFKAGDPRPLGRSPQASPRRSNLHRVTATIEKLLRDHVEAFNSRNLSALLAGFTDDAVWVTGRSTACGRAELTELFAGAIAGLLPTLTIQKVIAGERQAAAELVEEFSYEGVARVDHIAGFYVFRDGLIASAKIYREGSADLTASANASR